MATSFGVWYCRVYKTNNASTQLGWVCLGMQAKWRFVLNVVDNLLILFCRYGCCSDGYTYSQGPNYEDCPDTRTGYSLPYYPRDFIASKLDETADTARLSVSWSPPQDDSIVDLYVVRRLWIFNLFEELLTPKCTFSNDLCLVQWTYSYL